MALSRELEMCYVNISVVTDYDVGVEGEIAPVTHQRSSRPLRRIPRNAEACSAGDASRRRCGIPMQGRIPRVTKPRCEKPSLYRDPSAINGVREKATLAANRPIVLVPSGAPSTGGDVSSRCELNRCIIRCLPNMWGSPEGARLVMEHRRARGFVMLTVDGPLPVLPIASPPPFPLLA